MTTLTDLEARIRALPLPEGERLAALQALRAGEAIADALIAVASLLRRAPALKPQTAPH